MINLLTIIGIGISLLGVGKLVLMTLDHFLRISILRDDVRIIRQRSDHHVERIEKLERKLKGKK